MTLVICIGNELVADDAVGFEVHARLAALRPSGVELVYLGVGGIALLELLDGTQEALVVVDAVSLGAPVGTVHTLPVAALPRSGSAPISAHGIGLRETMEIGATLYPERMPGRVTLVGVEGRCFDLPRAHMTPEVAEAFGPAVRAVLAAVALEGAGAPLRQDARP